MGLVTRFFDEPRQSYFLFGPRGTGKSTWLEQNHPQAILVDLLRDDVFRSYQGNPERLRELVSDAPQRATVVIDEIQKCPQLLDEVHGLLEIRKDLKFVLTGSSARKLRRAGVNLLAGRALLRTLHPFMAAELGDAFRLTDALQLGLVPLVVAAEEPAEAVRSYAGLYVKEEVQAEGLVRNLGAFARVLEVVSFSHAAVLNMSNVARECEVKRDTVVNHIEILEDLLLAVRLPVFTRRAARTVIRHPKFYLFDAGLFRSLRPRGPLDRPEEIEGAALEGLVLQHLRAWNAYRGDRNTLYYWHTRRGVEVDFVVYGDDGLHAIEVKNAMRVHNRDLRPLKTFLTDYPESSATLLYRGSQRLVIDGIRCVPVEDYLTALVPVERLPESESQ